MRVFVAALPEELNGETMLFNSPVFFTGVGKINAALCIADICCSDRYSEIINIGSCGSTTLPIGSVHRIHKIYQDLDLSPISNCSRVLEIDSGDVSCFTTDTFFDIGKSLSERYKYYINHCDVVDMECYAIAEACRQYNVKFAAYKWVTDNGSGCDWETNKNIGYNKFKELYERQFKEN